MSAVAGFALVMLAACGGTGGPAVEEDVTRVPAASDAAVDATSEAATESSPAAGDDDAATPAAPAADATPAAMASPAAAATPVGMATPVAAAMASPVGEDMASPVILIVIDEDEATPVAEQAVATPMAATPVQASPVAADDGATPVGDASPVASEAAEIVSIDIAFEPKALTIPADTDVTVSLPNEGAAVHNFIIDELDISVEMPAGTTDEVVINAPAGTYEYYCNVPGHKEAGMIGELTVE